MCGLSIGTNRPDVDCGTLEILLLPVLFEVLDYVPHLLRLISFAHKQHIACIDDTVIVDAGDVLLVCKSDQAQKVRDVVEHLKKHRQEKYL